MLNFDPGASTLIGRYPFEALFFEHLWLTLHDYDIVGDTNLSDPYTYSPPECTWKYVRHFGTLEILPSGLSVRL